MLSSALASFAPLVLLALAVTAVPGGTSIPIIPSHGNSPIDLSPRITPNVTLFIDSKINFTSTWNIYDANATTVYTTAPANESFLIITNAQYPSEVQYMKLVSIRYELPFVPHVCLRRSYAATPLTCPHYWISVGSLIFCPPILQGSPSNCMSILSGSLYLDISEDLHQWTVKDATHKPDVFSPIYVPGHEGAPAGEIQPGPDDQDMIGKISRKTINS